MMCPQGGARGHWRSLGRWSFAHYDGGLRLIQQPIAELEQLRQTEVHLEDVVLEQGARPLTEFAPRRNTYEIDATFTIDDASAKFGLKLAANGDTSVQVGYDASTSTLFMDRTNTENSDFSRLFPKLVTAPLAPRDGTIRLQIFVDQSSIEVFANGGEVTMTGLIFPDHGSRGIEMFSDRGRAVMSSFRAWELKSIWAIAP